jgi:hypothetical protein
VAMIQAVPGRVFKIAMAIASTAGSGMGSMAGTGRREVPSSPDFPWMEAACTGGREMLVPAPR